MCLFRVKAAIPKGEPPQEYGVLLHNMTEESYYGTCLMNDGRLVTMSWDKLHQAFKRIMEWDCIISALKQNELREMYLAACADTTALELRIKKSQSEYKAAIELVRVKREAAREAAAALKNAKNPTLKARKKVKINDIRVNTHVSMYFTWEELESTLPRPSTVPDADGMTDMADQWRTGTVTKIDQNKWRKKVYTCVFDTPGKFTSPYNAQEILVARENYIKLKTSYHGIVESSSDDFSATDEDSNLVTPPKQAAPKSNIVPRSVRKIAGPHLAIPGTQLEATTLVEHENVDKDTTNELFVHCLFDTGALNLLVVLGLRLNLSCIVARNSLNHCTALGPLDRYALAHVIVFLGTGSSTKYKNLRNDMLENGMNLAEKVCRNHVTNLQGTVMWTDALSQELQLIEAFYNHNGNWDTKKNATMMEKITIKRDELHTVTHSQLSHEQLSHELLSCISVIASCRCTVDCTRMGYVLSQIFSTTTREQQKPAIHDHCLHALKNKRPSLLNLVSAGKSYSTV